MSLTRGLRDLPYPKIPGQSWHRRWWPSTGMWEGAQGQPCWTAPGWGVSGGSRGLRASEPNSCTVFSHFPDAERTEPYQSWGGILCRRWHSAEMSWPYFWKANQRKMPWPELGTWARIWEGQGEWAVNTEGSAPPPTHPGRHWSSLRQCRTSTPSSPPHRWRHTSRTPASSCPSTGTASLHSRTWSGLPCSCSSGGSGQGDPPVCEHLPHPHRLPSH